MYLSFSSFSSSTSPVASSYCGDLGLDQQVFCSAAAPYGLLPDTNGSFLPFPSSSPPCPSSFPSEYYLHRSSSTHSLPLHQHNHNPDPLNQPPAPYSSSPSSSCDYLDFNADPVRRALSAGDLQGMNGLHENYSQEGGGAAGRVGRYSAEERKERIERYRSKRNQRNFHKKITYACRKTLADSRPRVRGRFARNGETEADTEVEMEAASSFDGCSSDNYEKNQSYGVSGINGGGDVWSKVEAALAMDDDCDYGYDEDLLASFADVFSMNIPS